MALGYCPSETNNLGSSTASLRDFHADRLIGYLICSQDDDSLILGGLDAPTGKTAPWWYFNKNRIAPVDSVTDGPWYIGADLMRVNVFADDIRAKTINCTIGAYIEALDVKTLSLLDDLDLGMRKITGVGAATKSTDVTSKSYVDSVQNLLNNEINKINTRLNIIHPYGLRLKNSYIVSRIRKGLVQRG